MTFPRSTLAEQVALGRAGRLAPPVNWPPSDGVASFVLGSDVPGVIVRASVGDAVEVTNFGDYRNGGATAYVRFKAHVRPPASDMPVGVFWRLMASLREGVTGGSPTPRVELDLKDFNDREATHLDFAIPMIGLYATTVQQLSLRLELAGTVGDYDVELPAVYLDSVVLDQQIVRPTPINRVPDNEDAGVPIGADVYIEINDPFVTADTINGNVTDVQVYLSGVLAYDSNAGGFQTGFTGPDSVVSLHSAGLDGHRTVRLTIDPTSSLPSSTVIPVLIRARARTIPGSPREFNYSFTTEDLTAPTLVSATALDRRSVRVTTSEPVLSSAATGANDALNPGNWLIFVASTSLEDGLPAVSATVVAVTKYGEGIFDLTTDTELTRGAIYRVETGPLRDDVGNPMVSPNNRAFFVGYTCVGPDGRDFQLIDMLPGLNLNEDETDDLKKFIACFQEVTDLLLCDIDHWVDILDPDIAPERYVDAMLADLGNPFSFDLSEVDKRRLIRVLVPIYLLKGTDDGIINAVRFFVGVEVTITVPAFDGVWDLGMSELGDAFLGSSSLRDKLSFYVVSPVALTPEQRLQIASVTNYLKDARTHFLGILEPFVPDVPDHWELGLSELGTETLLH